MIGLKWENYQPTILNIVKLSYHNETKGRTNKTKRIYLKQTYILRKTKGSSSGWKEIMPDGNLMFLLYLLLIKPNFVAAGKREMVTNSSITNQGKEELI